MSVDLSIVIVSYNVLDLVKKCIESVYSFENEINFEIFLIDNNSSDGTVEHLNKKFQNRENLKIIGNIENKGFAAGNNQVLNDVNGEFVLFLNPDTELSEKNTLAKLVDFMRKMQNVGVCGPRLIFGNGHIQYSVGKKPTLYTTLLEIFLIPRFLPFLFKSYRYKDLDLQDIKAVDWVSGASLMIRHDLLNKLGGFDESLLMYAEDVDLCLRAQSLGYEIIFNPVSTVIHYEGQSSRKPEKQPLLAVIFQNYSFLKVLWRHNGKKIKDRIYHIFFI